MILDHKGTRWILYDRQFLKAPYFNKAPRFTIYIRSDDGCLVRPKHVAIVITVIKRCVLKGCIVIVAYYDVPSVLTNEVLTTESCHYQNFNVPYFSLMFTECVCFLCSVHSGSRYHLTSRCMRKKNWRFKYKSKRCHHLKIIQCRTERWQVNN